MFQHTYFHTFLSWLEGSSLSIWVNESEIGYPIVLSLHAVGMAVLVGLLLMVNLCLMRIIKDVPLQTLTSQIKLALLGAIVNLLSGLALFVSQATTIVTNVPFLTKIFMIILGVITTKAIQQQLSIVLTNPGNSNNKITLKGLAILSTIFWVAAITAGRLIAYFKPTA